MLWLCLHHTLDKFFNIYHFCSQTRRLFHFKRIPFTSFPKLNGIQSFFNLMLYQFFVIVNSIFKVKDCLKLKLIYWKFSKLSWAASWIVIIADIILSRTTTSPTQSELSRFQLHKLLGRSPVSSTQLVVCACCLIGQLLKVKSTPLTNQN